MGQNRVLLAKWYSSRKNQQTVWDRYSNPVEKVDSNQRTLPHYSVSYLLYMFMNAINFDGTSSELFVLVNDDKSLFARLKAKTRHSASAFQSIVFCAPISVAFGALGMGYTLRRLPRTLQRLCASKWVTAFGRAPKWFGRPFIPVFIARPCSEARPNNFLVNLAEWVLIVFYHGVKTSLPFVGENSTSGGLEWSCKQKSKILNCFLFQFFSFTRK